MKNILTIFLLVFLGCAEKTTQESIKKNQATKLNNTRTKLSESILHYTKYKADTLVLENARIYDGLGNAPKENQTAVIINGRFEYVGPSSEIDIPLTSQIINLKGKTIIPGIVGVHNHLHIPHFPFTGVEATKLYLASGVTTIQTCGAASPEKEILLAQEIASGKTLGPNIITSGPYFTGEGGNPNMVIPRNEKHLKDTLNYWINKGVRWFKVYRNTKAEDLKVIIEEAHKHKAKVTGHLCSITFEQATLLGIDGIEHGFNSLSDFRADKTEGVCDGSREYIDELEINSEKVRNLHQLMIDNNIFLTSTLAIYESSVPSRAYADERSLKAMSPFLTSQYNERRTTFDSSKANDNIREARLKRIMMFEYQFYKMGGTLTAGVDAGRHVLPGFGDQRNFELLREAGFTVEESIKIMTSNGAKVLSKNDIGTIEVGKNADFLIIEGNIENHIRNVDYVFKDGFGYDSKSILKDMEGQFGLE